MKKSLSTKKQEELVNKNRRLVHYLAKKLKVPECEYDDAVSEGTIGLIKAAITYDERQKATFATYASTCICNEIRMYFRKIKKHEVCISLDEEIFNDENDEYTLKDIIPSDERDFAEVIAEKDVFFEVINIVLNVLKQKERIIMLYMISGMKQAEIAKTLNYSRSYITRLEKTIKNKVKQFFILKMQYNKVYSMEQVGELYKISFSTGDIDKFNKSFSAFLNKIKSTKELEDLKVLMNKERVTIYLSGNPESFAFIAKLIEEVDEYSVKFL